MRWRWAAIGAGVAGIALQMVNIGVAIFIAYLAPSALGVRPAGIGAAGFGLAIRVIGDAGVGRGGGSLRAERV